MIDRLEGAVSLADEGWAAAYRRANEFREPLYEPVEGVLRDILWEGFVETGDDGLEVKVVRVVVEICVKVRKKRIIPVVVGKLEAEHAADGRGETGGLGHEGEERGS